MPGWNDIFSKKGKVFSTPHPDMERIAGIFLENKVKRILDLGCGTGRHLVYFSKKNFVIYGIDAAPRGLEIARKWLEEESACAELIHHRMEEQFPFEDNFFDAIISVQVLHHNLLKQVQFTVDEVARVIKPGGYIFITVPTFKAFNRMNWKLKEVEPNTHIPQEGPEKGLPHHFFTKEEIPIVFNAFNIIEMYFDATYHRAIIGVRKDS